jgi:hypothetical protein
VSLDPTASSGWYDHLAWSLEPLIRPDAVPEAGRLSLGGRYHEHLGEVFKGMLALARETQVKQLKAAVAGAKGLRETVIHISPDLSVEPLAELYRRRAACYRYVHGVLEEAFGTGTLRDLQRMTPEGPVEPDLASELTAILGWDRTLLHVRYEAQPTVVSCERDVRPRHPADGTGRPARRVVPGTDPAVPPRVEFQREWCEAATPVFAEVYVERLMDRDEFRHFCDRHRTREEILANMS